MIKGWKKLTKKERKHLSEHGILQSTFLAQRTFDEQQKLREKFPNSEPCWDCKFIAKKLGLTSEEK